MNKSKEIKKTPNVEPGMELDGENKREKSVLCLCQYILIDGIRWFSDAFNDVLTFHAWAFQNDSSMLCKNFFNRASLSLPLKKHRNAVLR